jgi:hypothetical protein
MLKIPIQFGKMLKARIRLVFLNAEVQLGSLTKKLGSARSIFLKARVLKFLLIRAFRRLLKKIIGKALF